MQPRETGPLDANGTCHVPNNFDWLTTPCLEELE